ILSMRRNMVSSGTGFEKSSYSLQYSQARMQRRMGMMCASNGWSVDTKARATSQAPRRSRKAALTRRRRRTAVDGIALLIKPHGGANAQVAAVFGGKCGVNGEFGLFWVRGRASKLSACWNDEWDNGHAHSGMVAERLMESAGSSRIRHRSHLLLAIALSHHGLGVPEENRRGRV